MRGKVPLAVESTSSLVEALLLDQQASRGGGGGPLGGALSEYSLRLRYALPLIKWVHAPAAMHGRPMPCHAMPWAHVGGSQLIWHEGFRPCACAWAWASPAPGLLPGVA